MNLSTSSRELPFSVEIIACLIKPHIFRFVCIDMETNHNQYSYIILFTNPSARAGYDTRSHSCTQSSDSTYSYLIQTNFMVSNYYFYLILISWYNTQLLLVKKNITSNNYCYWFTGIWHKASLFRIIFLNRSVWSSDGILIEITILGLSGSGSNTNGGVFHIFQISRFPDVEM